MGLDQGDVDHRISTNFRTWIVPGVIVIGALLIALAGDAGRDLLRYDRTAIADGEVWRLLSGHMAHLGWSHFVMNAIGLLLIFYLVGRRFGVRQWILISIVVILGIDLGFWVFEPQLIWYVGLSGLLHGYLAAGVTEGLRQRKFEDSLIAGLFVVKLVYEQIAGPLPGSEDTAGGNVVVAAHLYGALAGLLSGLLLSFRKASAPAI